MPNNEAPVVVAAMRACSGRRPTLTSHVSSRVFSPNIENTASDPMPRNDRARHLPGCANPDFHPCGEARAQRRTLAECGDHEESGGHGGAETSFSGVAARSAR